MKKTGIKIIICAILFAALAVSLLPMATAAEPATGIYTDKEFGLELSTGYGDSLVWMPYVTNKVAAKISNKTSADVEGTVVFTLSSWNGDTDVKKYVLPFSLAAGVSKTVDTSVMPDYNDYLVTCSVYDKRGRLLRFEQRSPASSAYSSGSNVKYLHIGWITDNKNDVSVLSSRNNDLLYFVNTFEETLLVAEALRPDSFPSDLGMMMSFSAIIVNKVDLSDSSTFSKKQVELLDDYLKAGGTVIVGTGSDTEILKAFSSYFAQSPSKAAGVSQLSKITDRRNVSTNGTAKSGSGNSESISIVRTDASVKLSGDNYEKFECEKLDVCDIDDANFTACPRPKDSPIGLYKHKDCNLFITNINLAQDQLKNSKNSAEYLMAVLYDSYVPLAIFGASDNSIDLNVIDNLFEISPSFLLIALFFILYACLGILLPYLIARKKRKAAIAWIGIPAGAVLFSLVFVGYTALLRGKNARAFSVEVSEFYGNGLVKSAYSAAVTSPNGGSKRVSFSDENACYLGTLSYVDKYSASYTPQASSFTVDYTKDSGLTTQGVRAWSYATAKASSVRNTAEGFEWSVSGSAPAILTVKNTSNKNYSGAFLFFWGNTVPIGEFKAGESKKFQLSGLESTFDAEQVIGELFYLPNGLPKSALSNKISNFGIPYNQNRYGYGSYYYYSSTNRIKAVLTDLLRVSEEDYVKAALIFRQTAELSENKYTNVNLICAFEEDAAPDVLLNGRKQSGAEKVRMVYQYLTEEKEIKETVLEEYDATLMVAPESQGKVYDYQSVEIDAKNTSVVAYLQIPFAYFFGGNWEINVTPVTGDEISVSPFYFVCENLGYSEVKLRKVEEKGNGFSLNLSDVYAECNLGTYFSTLKDPYGYYGKYNTTTLCPDVRFLDDTWVQIDEYDAPVHEDGLVTLFFAMQISPASSAGKSAKIDSFKFEIRNTTPKED